VVEIGTAVQIQNIVCPAPSFKDTGGQLEDTHQEGAQLTMKAEELIYLCFIMLSFIEIFRWMLRLFRSGRICDSLTQFVCWFPWLQYAVFSANWQPVMSKYYWINWQHVVSHRPKQRQMHISK